MLRLPFDLRNASSVILYFITFMFSTYSSFIFFFNVPSTTEIYPLSLHDALPISRRSAPTPLPSPGRGSLVAPPGRSEEHTSELQSPCNLVCRLLLEIKKIQII